jgi:excisionase family DNA binding protein
MSKSEAPRQTGCGASTLYIFGRRRGMGLSSREVYKVALREYPDVLNVEQLSEVLSVSTKTIYKIIRSGELQHLKAGREYRVPKVMVLQYMKLLQNKDKCI